MFTEYFNQLTGAIAPYFEGWDATVVSGVAALIVLVALWIFARVLRTVSVVLLAFCVVFLVLKVGFGVDLLSCLLTFAQ